MLDSSKCQKQFVFAVMMASVLAVYPMAANAQVKNEFEVGPYASYIKYEEPDIMDESGFMAGGFADYSAHFSQGLVLGVDGTLAWGQVDYGSVSTGSIDDINDFMGEVRGTVGYDIWIDGDIHRITPYVGFGYRYLFDELGGTTSTTGALGYDRESQYLYVPIGVKALCVINDDWKVGANVEFDWFVDGTQKSELGDALTGLNTLENNQDEGWGVRGSVKLIKKMEKVNLSFEPFIRYWNIDESDTKAITFGGTPVGVVGYEPKNNSTEVGMKIGLNY